MNSPLIISTSGTPSLDDTMLSVNMEGEGAYWLKRQANVDITLTTKGYPHSLFDLFELLDIDRLLPDEQANSVMTDSESKLLAQYAAYYHAQLLALGDEYLAGLYDGLLQRLLNETTIITFQL